MYEQSFYHGRITEIELEQATRRAERARALRERLGLPERRDGLIRRMRAALAARRAGSAGGARATTARAGSSPAGREVPCTDCPAAA
ncbi:hypothetical protein L2X99_12930 [Microbacterium sp. KUDC0406]|uniref:hypothetical protein n=1 Tax=Microbacterium sp. KUDC0406 TaxID=2909588 RepID=UPI001F34F7CA|nr:hypothetical protein [Microbacterium sp. KUDC0406]UJP09331.1 hypothetical protein L2X99_12930 [Microbacterium sp. KUDC0406]